MTGFYFWTGIYTSDCQESHRRSFDGVTDEHLAHCPGIKLQARFDGKEEKADVLRALLRAFQGFEALRKIDLDVGNFQEVLPVPTICLAVATLKKLRATWFHRQGNDTVFLADLKSLYEHCPLLEDLEIDMPMCPYQDVPGYPKRDIFEADDFLLLLPKFESLKQLQIHAERSFGCVDPMNAPFTDPDYYYAHVICETLFKIKKGLPFESVTITLNGAYQPENWRKAPGGSPDSSESQYHWCVRRKWRATLRNGQLDFEVLQGSPFVGEAPEETDEERAKANEEWMEYQHHAGDGTPKHMCPLFSPGMSVWVSLDSLPNPSSENDMVDQEDDARGDEHEADIPGLASQDDSQPQDKSEDLGLSSVKISEADEEESSLEGVTRLESSK